MNLIPIQPGIRAEYRIPYEDLHQFVAADYERLKNHSAYANDRDFVRDYHDFMALPKHLSADASGEIILNSPRARNGAGFHVRYDVGSQRSSASEVVW